MSSLVLVPQHFGALLFDRRTSRYLPFDADAAAALARLIDAPADSDDEIDLAAALAARGYLRLDGRLAATRIDRAPPADHLLGPLAVHLEIIGACNLACTHCFAGALPRNHDALTLAEMERLFGALAALGSFRLGLTGGEPLLRKDLFDIVDGAVAAGLHPCLTTNGLLLDHDKARAFRERTRRAGALVWLNVSLDGARQETNDAVRGAGTFDAVIEKLALLRAHDVRFTLAFTITSKNAHEVEDCAALAFELGADTAVFRPLYPVGMAAHAPALMPSYAQYAGALARLERFADHNRGLADVDAHALDAFSPSAREALRGTVMPASACGAGHTIASISVQGDVSPCSFLGRAFEDGNLRARSFEDIWNDGRIFARVRAGGAADRFRGGCRARAQAFAGSAFAADPWQTAHDEGAAPSSSRSSSSSSSSRPRGGLPIIDGGGASSCR